VAALAVFLAAAPAPAAQPQRAMVVPESARVTAGDYPSGTKAAGKVLYRLDIDRTGKPVGCTILRSSGAAALDDATCRVAARFRFRPARDADGIAGEDTSVSNMVWQRPGKQTKLERTGPAIRARPRLNTLRYEAEYPTTDRTGTLQLVLTVTPQGRVAGCRISLSSNSAEIDRTFCAFATGQFTFEPARNAKGTAVADEATFAFSFKPKAAKP
jgi:TonB family protein